MQSIVNAPMRKHTQLVYGNLNDSFVSDSLSWLDIEQMMLNMCREAGIQYVLFYSGALRGACCYDEASAAFFFGDHKLQTTAAPAPKEDDLKDVSIASMMHHNRHKKPIPLDAQQAAGDRQVQPVPSAPQTEKPIRFGMRSWTLPEVVTTFITLLNHQNAPRMALIFNNIQTTALNSEPLLATLLTTLERHSANGSMCFILAPGTESRNLEHTMQRVGPLDSMFSERHEGTGCQALCAASTWYVGEPGLDEIGNAISRLNIIGTPKGNKLSYQGRLHDLAHALYYASHDHKGSAAATLVPLNLLMDKLIDYADNAQGEPLTVKKAYAMWHASEPPKDALECLNKPGWENAYTVVKKIVEDAKSYYEQHHSDACTDDVSCVTERFAVLEKDDVRFRIPHFLIYGNPGTGKTSIARLIGRVLYEAGILRKGNVVEVSQAKMVSPYVGGVQTETLKAVDSAIESVLLLDDAQSLNVNDGGSNHEGTGTVIVKTLVPEMTRTPFSLILAGYENILKVLEKDEGLARRIGPNIIKIPDYKPDLLERIFRNEAAERGVAIDESLLTPIPGDSQGRSPLACMFDTAYLRRDRKTFGNADFAIRLLDGAMCNSKGKTIRLEHMVGVNNVTEAWFEPINVGMGAAAVLNDFEREFVGMTAMKERLSNIARQVMDSQCRGLPLDNLYCEPIILSAAPGAGKTTVAGVLSRMYFTLGMLGTPDLIRLSAAELNSGIVNGNSETMLKYIHQAQDRKAMLFIDEAVQFLEHGRQEAFKTLIEPLTNFEKPFMLVLACYRDRVQDLLRLDSGAIRRFKVLNIDDYTGEELHAIFQRQLAKEGLCITPEALEMMQPVCDAIHDMGMPENRNGGATGELVKVLDTLRLKRINPTLDPTVYDALGSSALLITAEDVNSLVGEGCSVLNEKQCHWIMAQLGGMGQST